MVSSSQEQKQAATTNNQDAISTNELPSFTFRGRYFSSQDIELISACVREHYDKGRTYISEVICENLNWKQPNGWLKDRACRDVLVQLEKQEIIKLPPSLVVSKPNSKKKKKTTNYLAEFDIETAVTAFPNNIILEFAKGNKTERVWNEVVNKHHYLGHESIVGRCIKYLVKEGDTILGAIAFASPSWRLSIRDEILQQVGIETDAIRDLVVNNCRFLILPNVTVPNLASKILSLATEQIVIDWSWYYAITPKVTETFVDPTQYTGTCYRAANWVEIGSTKGYAKKGSYHHNSQEPKQIFLYGLNKRTRRKLQKIARTLSQEQEQ